MKFRRARFQNFRLLRDLEIEFSAEEARPLTVIRAENETGKTTILNALQWALFGDEALPSRGAEYRLHPIDWEDPSRTVDILVELEFEHTYERKNRDGNWIESTEVYLARRSATESIHGPNSWSREAHAFELLQMSESGYTPLSGGELLLRQILESNVKDLFFTDGDRALSFITSEISVGEKRKRVQKAIRDMLGFEMLESAITHVRKAIADIQGRVREFGGGEELEQLFVRKTDIESRIVETEKRIEEIDDQLSQLAVDLQAVEQKIEAALAKGDKEQLMHLMKQRREERSKAREQLDKLRREHSNLFNRESLALFLLKDHIRKSGATLDDLRAKGRIPRTAIPVLTERLELGICICGEPLEPGHARYQHVIELIDEQRTASATDDRLTTLRLVANQKLPEIMDSPSRWYEEVRAVVERRDELETRIRGFETELKELEDRLEKLPETDIAFLREQRRALREARDNLNREHGVKQSDLRALQQQKKEIDTALATLQKRQAISHRLQSRLTAAEDILEVIRRSYATIEQAEVPQVSGVMNELFLEMIRADPEQNAIIQVAEVTPSYDIAVYGPQTRRLDPDRDLNGASRRALTLAFILALAQVSNVKAPNVIDTPLGMMDPLIKQSVLGTAVHHCAQLILFLTRSEIRDCEELLDRFAGKVITLTNSAHYPTMLCNDPGGSYRRVLRCECNHRQYCAVCERVTDADAGYLKKRAMSSGAKGAR